MAKAPFPNPNFWLSILAKLEELSDDNDQISHETIKMIRMFRIIQNPTPVETWNFLKKLLDFIVFTGGASSFVITIIDVEPHYAAPPGNCYQRNNGSIENAPWRLNCPW